MKYEHTVSGFFIKRPNRFIAHVEIKGKEEICHIKNTGRLGELLLPGSELVLQFHPDARKAGRKTEYSVIGVYKENAGFSHERQLVNIDSQAPNTAAYQWVENCCLFQHVSHLRREVTFHSSRFDLAFCENEKQTFMEVKGVTLENNGIASFPDAPTLRGVKHIEELCRAAREGFGASLLFVIQMKGIHAFTPNEGTHPEFAEALRDASRQGVHLMAFDCLITPDSIQIDQEIPILL